MNMTTQKPNNSATQEISDDVALSVRNVSKKFCKNLRRSMTYGIADLARNLVGIRPDSTALRRDEFWALRDVSFELHKGEALGLIGANGSGKSTLLRMIAGIFPPDEGEIAVRGRVGALIALGAGFHPHMTGRENIYLNGSILGMTRAEIDAKYNDIVEFSGIADFMEAPVSTYSSGMRVRLGFSVAVHVEPDILLVDEVLAVGDMWFQRKCLERIDEMTQRGCTLIFVSHKLQSVEAVCKKVIWLESGRTREIGETAKVLGNYVDSTHADMACQAEPARSGQFPRFGSGEIRIVDVTVRGASEEEGVVYCGENVTISINCENESREMQPRFWVAICDAGGKKLAGAISEPDPAQIFSAKGRMTLRCVFPAFPFLPGVYSLIVGILDKELSAVPYDRWGGAARFAVQMPRKDGATFVNPDLFGIVNVNAYWEYPKGRIAE